MKHHKITTGSCDDCGTRKVSVIHHDLGLDVPSFAACKACDEDAFQEARDAATEVWLAGGQLPL